MKCLREMLFVNVAWLLEQKLSKVLVILSLIELYVGILDFLEELWVDLSI